MLWSLKGHLQPSALLNPLNIKIGLRIRSFPPDAEIGSRPPRVNFTFSSSHDQESTAAQLNSLIHKYHPNEVILKFLWVKLQEEASANFLFESGLSFFWFMKSIEDSGFQCTQILFQISGFLFRRFIIRWISITPISDLVCFSAPLRLRGRRNFLQFPFFYVIGHLLCIFSNSKFFRFLANSIFTVIPKSLLL